MTLDQAATLDLHTLETVTLPPLPMEFGAWLIEQADKIASDQLTTLRAEIKRLRQAVEFMRTERGG